AAVLAHIDFASGAIAFVAPADIAQGVVGMHKVDAASDVIGVAITEHADHTALDLRQLDASGNVVWSVSDPLDDTGYGSYIAVPEVQAALSTDRIAVAFPSRNDVCYSNRSGWEGVAVYDRATGARRWRVVLRDTDQMCTWSSSPKIDTAGNVFVSVSALVQCVGSNGCQRRTLYKLSASDGAVVWRRDESLDAGIEGLVLYPQEFVLLGSDVLAAGVFVGSSDSVQRYAGADGSLQWSSGIFSDQNISSTIEKLDDHHVIVHGGFSEIRWAALDADTGAVLWSSTAPVFPCSAPSACVQSGDPLTLPNGDKLSIGEREYKAFVARVHNDGSSIIDSWMLGADNPNLTSWVSQAVLDPAGKLHVVLHRRDRKIPGSISFFAEFDLATGSLSGQRALYAYRADPADAGAYPRILKMPTSDQVLADTFSVQPTLPTTDGAALIDMSVTAHGDIATDVGADSSHVEPGMLIGFHATVTYSGDQPIAGAHLVLNLPWQSGVGGLTCATQSASACLLDSRSGNVRATFDALPGGSITVSGQVAVLDVNAPVLYAFAYGPGGLSEQDTDNNFARATVAQSLFFDGFDGGN
ncbi:MAG: PQQ-binding-like beta-propeller repeat protein, partial [Dokdonella sp.]